MVSDKVKNTSWRDVGATGGKKIDEVRTKVNEKYVDANGVTPEQHFRVGSLAKAKRRPQANSDESEHCRRSMVLQRISSGTPIITPGVGGHFSTPIIRSTPSDSGGHEAESRWCSAWVPFTKQKAREAKEKAMHTDLATLKADAKYKGLELKDDALTAVSRPTLYAYYMSLLMRHQIQSRSCLATPRRPSEALSTSLGHLSDKFSTPPFSELKPVGDVSHD